MGECKRIGRLGRAVVGRDMRGLACEVAEVVGILAGVGM